MLSSGRVSVLMDSLFLLLLSFPYFHPPSLHYSFTIIWRIVIITSFESDTSLLDFRPLQRDCPAQKYPFSEILPLSQGILIWKEGGRSIFERDPPLLAPSLSLSVCVCLPLPLSLSFSIPYLMFPGRDNLYLREGRPSKR